VVIHGPEFESLSPSLLAIFGRRRPTMSDSGYRLPMLGVKVTPHVDRNAAGSRLGDVRSRPLGA
jgi:hypothetical protein